MSTRLRSAPVTPAAYIRKTALAWRHGTQRGQVFAMAALVVITAVIFVASLVSYVVVPVASFVLPLLLGSIALRYRPLLVLVGIVATCAAISVTRETIGSTQPR